MSDNTDLTQEQVDQLGQQLAQEAEVAPSVTNEDINIPEEEALILRYEQLKDVVVRASTTLSSRAMGRIMRAAIRHPFDRAPKFENGVEKMVFDAFTQATDIKMMYVNKLMKKLEEQQQSTQQGIQEAAKAASEVTEASTEES